jgi:hypothetical protein
MTAKIEPRNGIKHTWSLGENGWNEGMDENLLKIGLVGMHLSVIDKDISTPPGAPTDGDSYLVGPTATGSWAGLENQIVVYDTDIAGWRAYAPRKGWLCFVEDEDTICIYKSSSWETYSSGGDAAAVTADTTNFNNNLSAADDTVQKALETLDELIASASGSAGSFGVMAYEYTSGTTQTVFTGADDNAATLDIDGYSIMVIVDGVFLSPDEYSGTTDAVTLDVAAPDGSDVTIWALNGALNNVTTTAISETEKTDHDATAGGTITLVYADGNSQTITADDTAFTIAKGTWPTGVTASMLLYISASAGVGAITWSGWGFANAEPDGSGITTYGLYEILCVNGAYFIFIVEEG